VKIEATHYIKSSRKEEKEVRIYITSFKKNAEEIGKSARSHRGIENNLHWQLDVSFNEDDSKKERAMLRKIFLCLIALHLISLNRNNREREA
jgi:predicted transposase YbfD/YdcC